MDTLLPFVAVIAIVAFAIRYGRDCSVLNEEDDVSYLRHAIDVNLQLLRAELPELAALAAERASSAETSEASRLLGACQTFACSADMDLAANNKKQLGALLSRVFAAMGQATKARRLLGACKPFPTE